MLRSRVQRRRIDRREDDRVRPLPAFLEDRRFLTGEFLRVRIHLPLLARAAVEPREERAVVAAGVEDVGILRIGRDVSVFRAAGAVRLRRAASTPAAAATPAGRLAVDADRSVALLRAAQI